MIQLTKTLDCVHSILAVVPLSGKLAACLIESSATAPLIGHGLQSYTICLMRSFLRADVVPISIQLTSNIRKLPLLQLVLPEYGVRISESMFDPPFLLDMVKIDESS